VLQEIKSTHYPKEIDSFIRVFEIMRGEFDSVWTTMENTLSSFCGILYLSLHFSFIFSTYLKRFSNDD
jgi:hypothetical protein